MIGEASFQAEGLCDNPDLETNETALVDQSSAWWIDGIVVKSGADPPRPFKLRQLRVWPCLGFCSADAGLSCRSLFSCAQSADRGLG